MTSICNGGDADVWQSLVVLVRPASRCAKTRNCTPCALASSGSYPERLKNAAQSELPFGCSVADMRHASRCVKTQNCTRNDGFGSWGVQKRGIAHGTTFSGIGVCKNVELHTTLLHPPEVILSGWKMPLSPNFQSDAIVNALVGMDS